MNFADDTSHETNNDRPDNTHVKDPRYVCDVSSEGDRRVCIDQRQQEALAKVSPGVPLEIGPFVAPARPIRRPQLPVLIEGGKLLICTLVDPGLRSVSLPVLLEPFEQLSQSSA
jgi:hypothetical protein